MALCNWIDLNVIHTEKRSKIGYVNAIGLQINRADSMEFVTRQPIKMLNGN
jgi:hypothetical protein